MLKRGLALIMSFAMASFAFGGATVDLVVTDFGNTPCGDTTRGCFFSPVSGPFNGGETILVHVMVTTDTDISLRRAQIDWRASSPELKLGQDIDAVNQPLDGIPNFWFDYSTIVVPFSDPVSAPLGTFQQAALAHRSAQRPEATLTFQTYFKATR